MTAAREALAASDLSAYDEYNLIARFGPSLTTADYDRRLDRLLSERKATDAQRLLQSVEPGAARGLCGADRDVSAQSRHRERSMPR